MPKYDDIRLIRDGVKAYEAWRRLHHKEDSTLWRDRVARGLEAQGYPVRRQVEAFEPGDAKEDE